MKTKTALARLILVASSIATSLLLTACAENPAAVDSGPSISNRGLGSGHTSGSGMTSGDGRGVISGRY